MADVSIIIPIYNGENWINKCMNSISTQTIFKSALKLEIVVFNDGSIDRTEEMLESWMEHFKNKNVDFILTGSSVSLGVGAAKNGAVKKSTGKYLCFQDIDDVMYSNRIILQWGVAKKNYNALVGSKIVRFPPDSTPRLVEWANNLSESQLKLQIYTSNGPTLLMPTWFCHRSVYDQIGGFDESGRGTPEDLIFFYSHLDAGGELYRVDEELLIYTYHEGAATFSVKRECIWQIQLKRLESHVFPYWNSFTIWNAGKAGRRLARSLSSDALKKVVGFCDVDNNKIGRTIELYCPIQRKVIISLPVVHYSHAKPPLLICVKLNLTNGQFENNLKSLNLTEGIDYILFS